MNIFATSHDPVFCAKSLDNKRVVKMVDGDLTPHPNCTTFKSISDVHQAYQTYTIQKWTNDKLKPKWFNDSKFRGFKVDIKESCTKKVNRNRI